MSTVPHQRPFTVREYLEREERSPTKHEFYQGEIFAMAGASIRHNVIAGNVFAILHALLKGTGCRPYSSDQRIKIETAGLFTYADICVICGDVQRAADDSHSAANPRVIVEVLSDSTEAYDRGEKFRLYRQLDSLQEYVLVSQIQPRIDKFVRYEDGAWLMSPVDSLEESVELKSIGCRLRLAEIYDGVKFGPEPASGPQAE